MQMGEKFAFSEVTALRNELIQGGLDSRQTAEMLQVFLMGRGYGVSPEVALDAAGRVECAGLSLESIQQELEKMALVM
jgi:hypothetical protein